MRTLRRCLENGKVFRVSTAVQIEAAIRELPLTEARAIAQWLEAYLSKKGTAPAPVTEHAFSKWRGRGRLPLGQNTDDYLRLISDGNGG